jgi:hypothetical protein
MNYFEKKIFERTNMTVIDGPFKGMKIVPEGNWGSGDLIAKLIGSYENELYPSLEEVFALKPTSIINVGCAEGFYGIGCGLRLPSAEQITFVDIDAKSLQIARKNAAANGLHEERCIFATDSSICGLSEDTLPFIFMDCEGAEYEILDPTVRPGLSKAIIMVELHPFYRPGQTIESMASRFAQTHHVRVIKQGPKNPYIPLMEDFPDAVKMHMICENRPCTMYWLYMVPKDLPLYYYLNKE